MRKDKSGNCQKCGIWRQSLHRDHIVPKFKGGDESLENIQFLCTNCHEDKTRIDLTGAKRSDAVRAKMSASQTGSKDTDITRAKKSAASKGRKKTPEHIEAVRLALKKFHANKLPGTYSSWNRGKKGHLSVETLKKMRDSHLGQPAWNKGQRNVER